MKDPHYVPRTLDEPIRIVLLTVDEAVVFLLPLLVLGFGFNALIVGFLVGAGGVILLKKLKNEQGHDYALHLAYWYLPPVLTLRVTPPSFQRSYIG